uniref:HAUS augmin like complex subunit 2 n=1 Tax=Leptobrachium leishanense TaxID=445787 RepID=A0A8C5R0P4_9ANUR
MMAANPWNPVQPTAAAQLIEKCLGCGVLTQVLGVFTRNGTKLGYTKNLELELLKLEQEAADITHPFFLSQKCHALQVINSHLEAVLKEKRTLRQRLAKPLCQENLPIEASYHRNACELLNLAVSFIEKLDVYLKTIQTIPQIPEKTSNMDNALMKMESLEAEVENLVERILAWREEQYGLLQTTYWNNRSSNASISYLSIENLHN